MVLRKITFDNSVRYIPKSEQIKEKVKADSLPHKQNKKSSQNSRKFLRNISASGIKYLKRIMNCYF